MTRSALDAVLTLGRDDRDEADAIRRALHDGPFDELERFIVDCQSRIESLAQRAADADDDEERRRLLRQKSVVLRFVREAKHELKARRRVENDQQLTRAGKGNRRLLDAIRAHRDATLADDLEPTEFDETLWAVLEGRDEEVAA